MPVYVHFHGASGSADIQELYKSYARLTQELRKSYARVMYASKSYARVAHTYLYDGDKPHLRVISDAWQWWPRSIQRCGAQSSGIVQVWSRSSSSSSY